MSDKNSRRFLVFNELAQDHPRLQVIAQAQTSIIIQGSDPQTLNLSEFNAELETFQSKVSSE